MEHCCRALRVNMLCESFTTVTHGQRNKKIRQQFIPEKDDWVHSSMTMGHAMHTVGLYFDQLLWCEKCGAHPFARARALKTRCKRKMGNQPAAERLMRGMHPYRGALLANATR